eukprot:15078082-Alexandrium_andersonii.AAC.1
MNPEMCLVVCQNLCNVRAARSEQQYRKMSSREPHCDCKRTRATALMPSSGGGRREWVADS